MFDAWFKLLGIGFAAAGASKLFRLRPQQELFASWGWPEDVMKIVGGLELAGAVLLVGRRGRVIGGATLAATSVAVLAAEIENENKELIPMRAGMLAAVLTALAA
jgi:uncharacterized membrane protein YphA (DoxX/SURF4 family)